MNFIKAVKTARGIISKTGIREVTINRRIWISIGKFITVDGADCFRDVYSARTHTIFLVDALANDWEVVE